nr:AAA1 variant V [Homo sapiens]
MKKLKHRPAYVRRNAGRQFSHCNLHAHQFLVRRKQSKLLCILQLQGIECYQQPYKWRSRCFPS